MKARLGIAVALMVSAAAPPPTPVSIGGVGGFDLSPLPVVSGVVARVLPAPQGGFWAVLLGTGEEVVLPPELRERPPRLGSVFTARGLQAPGVRLWRAFAIERLVPWAILAGESGGAREMDVSGVVTRILYDVSGRPCGALLRDGTVMILPEAAAASLAPGRTVQVEGTGWAGAFGSAVQVRWLGVDGGSPTRVVGAAPGAPPGSPEYDRIGE